MYMYIARTSIDLVCSCRVMTRLIEVVEVSSKGAALDPSGLELLRNSEFHIEDLLGTIYHVVEIEFCSFYKKIKAKAEVYSHY